MTTKMSEALRIKNLVTNIAKFQELDDMFSFKKSKNKINVILSAKNNDDVNGIFFNNYMKMFLSEDDEENTEKRIEYNLDIEINKTNWEEKFKEANEHLEKMKTLGDELMKSMDFIFKYKIYLPDLRKSNTFVEFVNSTIFMMKFYDFNKLETMEKCYYDKYINKEYIMDSTGNKAIVPLRKKQHYEKELLNLRESFNEIKGNKRYIKILTEQIMEYNYISIENEYKDMKKEDLEKINPIISFVWLVTIYFKFYLIYVKASIIRIKNNSKKFLTEFIKQQNGVTNVILFLNNNFNNVNIIINYWYKFLNKNEKSEKKFTLLNLFLKMYKEYIYNSLIDGVIDEFDKYLKHYKKEEEKNESIKKNAMIIDSGDSDSLNSTNDSSYSSDEESMEQCEEYSIVDIIEDLGNCILDMELNEQNAKGINHTGFLLSDKYEKYETVLINSIKRKLENLKEKEALNIFEEIKPLLETIKNPRFLSCKNVKLINRTKKKLTEAATKILVDYATNKFNITNKNYKYVSPVENFNDFSEKGERNIKEKAENELNIIKNMLKEKFMNTGKVPKEIEELVNSYVDKNGDDIVILAKKVIYFFYKEKQFYKENNKKIIALLKGDNDSFFPFIN